MALSSVISIFFLVIGSLSSPAVAGGGLRKVNMREVEADLQASLSDMLSGGSASAVRRVAKIEASTWQTFQSLPKNAAGRLAPQAVRYLVHGYFAKEHGWLINGLEPHGMQAGGTQIHEVSILQDKVPLLVERLLEVRQADRGLALSDVVAMVAVLEQLMFDESVTLLEASYQLLGISTVDDIDEAALHRVLQGYLILFGAGSKADLSGSKRLQSALQFLPKSRPDTVEFEHDTVLNYEYAHRHQVNPFKASLYSFAVVVEIMEDLAQHYGKWQNADCRDMKAHLAELDSEGLGRVPLSLFLAQPEKASYHFSESAEYLRKIGALDEALTPGYPQVMITNYVAGPSNCIASSSYYSVCCLSECEGILSEIEREVLAPTATPEQLLAVLSHRIDDGLPKGMPEKLKSIAAQNGGEVPLHGRLFAQWLHFAFPLECPYPSVLESATALTASQWLGGEAVASAKEREEHLAAVAPLPAKNVDIDGLWSDHEVLPLHEPTSSSLGIMRTFVQIVAILVVLRSALAAWSVAAPSRDGAKKKNDDYILPYSIRV